MQAATKAASEAFKSWSQTTLLHRQQLTFRLAELIRRDLVGLFSLWNFLLNPLVLISHFLWILITEKDREEHHDGAGEDTPRRGGRRNARPAYVSDCLFLFFFSILEFARASSFT